MRRGRSVIGLANAMGCELRFLSVTHLFRLSRFSIAMQKVDCASTRQAGLVLDPACRGVARQVGSESARRERPAFHRKYNLFSIFKY